MSAIRKSAFAISETNTGRKADLLTLHILQDSTAMVTKKMPLKITMGIYQKVSILRVRLGFAEIHLVLCAMREIVWKHVNA
jgi:hypothetical protein